MQFKCHVKMEVMLSEKNKKLYMINRFKYVLQQQKTIAKYRTMDCTRRQFRNQLVCYLLTTLKTCSVTENRLLGRVAGPTVTKGGRPGKSIGNVYELSRNRSHKNKKNNNTSSAKIKCRTSSQRIFFCFLVKTFVHGNSHSPVLLVTRNIISRKYNQLKKLDLRHLREKLNISNSVLSRVRNFLTFSVYLTQLLGHTT